MKYLVVSIVALGVGTAALAQATPPPPAKAPDSYPPCSSTVTDECVNPSQEPHHSAMHQHKRHAGRHVAHRPATHEASKPN